VRSVPLANVAAACGAAVAVEGAAFGVKLSISALIILPCSPLPVTCERSMPFS